jgi:hypothetical protein
MDKPNLIASATDHLDATAAAPTAAPAADIETIENATLVTATGGYWGGPYAYAVPAWGPAYRPMYAAPAWGPYAAWGPGPGPRHWWR